MNFIRLCELPFRKPIREHQEPREELFEFRLELLEQMRNHRLIHVLIKSSKFLIDLLGHCEFFELPEPAIVLLEHFLDLVLDSELPMMLNEVVESFGHVLEGIREE